MNNDPVARKAALRRGLEASRVAHLSSLTDEQRCSWADAVADAVTDVPEVRAAIAAREPIATYVSYGGEPPTGALNHRLTESGADVWRPIYRDDTGAPTHELRWRNLADDTELSSRELISNLAVVIVPALAATREGVRIGKGKGYYDKFLAGRATSSKRPYAIAVVRDVEVISEIPHEAHDIRVAIALGIPSPVSR